MDEFLHQFETLNGHWKTILSSAINFSSDLILITDISGKILYVNPSFLKDTGYELTEVLGKNPNMLNSGHQPPEFFKNLWETILSGNVFQGVVINKKKNLELFFEDKVIIPILNSQNEISYFISSGRNITDSIYKEKELIKAREKAEESSKLKSVILSNLNHEFRTPMNGILGFSELIENVALDDEIKHWGDIINASGIRLMKTLETLISVAELESGERKLTIRSFSICENLQNLVTQFLEDAQAKGINLKLDILEDNIIINQDPDFFNQAIKPILENAIKFTNSGEVRVSILKKIKSGFDAVEISITDTGIGIDETQLGLIFKDFRQISQGFNRGFEGLGLGLTLSKKLVDLMGGSIKVESKINTGTRFVIEFPLAKEIEASSESNYQNGQKVDPYLPISVLLIEDNELFVPLLRTYLGKLGTLDHAIEGLSGFNMCLKKAYDVLLIDINLGYGIDGVQTLNKIRQIKGYEVIPAIAVTGYVSETDEEYFLTHGFNYYLRKPFTRESFMNIITNCFII